MSEGIGTTENALDTDESLSLSPEALGDDSEESRIKTVGCSTKDTRVLGRGVVISRRIPGLVPGESDCLILGDAMGEVNCELVLDAESNIRCLLLSAAFARPNSRIFCALRPPGPPTRGLLSTAELERGTTGEAESIEEEDGKASALCRRRVANASSVDVALYCEGSVPTTIEASAPASSSASSTSSSTFPSEIPSGPSSSKLIGASSSNADPFGADSTPVLSP